MSWAEAKKINGDMTKSLDALIIERMNASEAIINALRSTPIPCVKKVQRGVASTNWVYSIYSIGWGWGIQSLTIPIQAVDISKCQINISGYYCKMGPDIPPKPAILLSADNTSILVGCSNPSINGTGGVNYVMQSTTTEFDNCKRSYNDNFSWEVIEFY